MIKTIHIVLSSSNEFIEHCATTMASILYNLSEDYMAHFYILSYDLTDKSKKKLAKLNKIKKCIIEYPSFDERLLDMFDGIQIPPHVTKMTYARILIPDILPEVKKAIFVDSDMVVRTDISKLYEIDIMDDVLAAVEDFNWKNISNRLWNHEEYYFNAGLLLIDAQKLRSINYLSIIKKQIYLNKDKYTICDQDVINDSFRGKIYRLSISWNFYHGVFFERFKCYTPDNMEEFKTINNSPNIVHYVGPEKPWLPSVHHPFKKDYFFFNRMTDFYRLWRSQKYYLYDKKFRTICFYDIPLYIKTSLNGKKTVEILGYIFNINKIKNIFIQKIKTDQSYKLKVLNLTIISKKDTVEKKFIKILGLPIYYKKDNAFFLHKMESTIFSELQNLKRELNILHKTNELLNKKLSNTKSLIIASKLHNKTFGKYKNAFEGKEVVLVCTGPTANKYVMIPNAIHVGVNGAIYLQHIKLDYLFVQDYTILQKNNSTLNDDALFYEGNNCKKFFGIIPDDKHKYVSTHDKIERIPLKYSYKKNVRQYILEDMTCNNIAYDLSYEPVGEFMGTPFSALQFILYAHPKKLYLVGWDCGSGYAYGKKNALNPANYQIDILRKYFLPFIKVNYPDIEIVSINPVGLKGFFNDVYKE